MKNVIMENAHFRLTTSFDRKKIGFVRRAYEAVLYLKNPIDVKDFKLLCSLSKYQTIYDRSLRYTDKFFLVYSGNLKLVEQLIKKYDTLAVDAFNKQVKDALKRRAVQRGKLLTQTLEEMDLPHFDGTSIVDLEY